MKKRNRVFFTSKSDFNLKNLVENYLSFLPNFLKASGSAFIVDSLVFTSLRPSLGTNNSAIISFLFGTLTLFSILHFLNLSRIKSKRIAILIQLFIGIGSFAINLLILNLIDSIFFSINYSLFISTLDKSFIYAFAIRFIAACFGFIWTSVMTNKFTFYSLKRK